MKLILSAIAHPRALVLLAVFFAAFGTASFAVLPRLEDPRLTPRFGLVVTGWPGATAERIEALITDPIEDRLESRAAVKSIESTSRAGVSFLRIELGDEVLEVNPVWSRLRDDLSEVALLLPEGASEPRLETDDVDTYTLLVSVSWAGPGEAPLGILRRLGDELEDRLRSVSGTEWAQDFGSPREELQVLADPVRLARVGLSPQALGAAIAEADAKGPAGRLRGAGSELSIEVSGEISALDRLADLPIAVDAGDRTLRLGELAEISRSIEQPTRQLSLIHGRRAVVVGARMGAGQRVDRWTQRCLVEVEQLQSELPSELLVEPIFQQSSYTESRLQGLLGSLATGGALVVLVVFFAMGWRAAILLGFSLPLAAAGTLAAMQVTGVPLHQMSVTGLIIALGLMIDAGIVMVHEVRHRVRDGEGPTQAATGAIRHLMAPLLGSTITTALALMPIVLLPGPAGEFVGTIGIVVILALCVSLLISLTILPWLAARGSSSGKASFWRRGFQSERLAHWYRAGLRVTIRNPLLAAALALALPIIGFAKASTLREQFFPGADRDQFQVQLELPASADIEATTHAARLARTTMLAHEEVSAVHTFIGRAAPTFYYNMLGGDQDAPNTAQFMVQLRDAEHTSAVIRELQQKLEIALPHAAVLALQFEQGPPFNAPVEIRITGPDLDGLARIGEEMRNALLMIEDVTLARSTLEGGRPTLKVELQEAESRAAGFEGRAIARGLEAWTEGVLGGSLIEGTEELPVRVRLKDSQRGRVEGLFSLPLPGRGDEPLPLGAVAAPALEPEWSSIPRRNGQRVNTIEGFIQAGVLPSTVLAAIQTDVDRIAAQLPPGYTIAFGGEAEGRDEAVGALLATVVPLLVLMVATIVLALGSFRRSLLVGVVAVCAFGLAMTALWVFQFPRGFMAIVGTIGLMGIAINDTIVVLAGLRDSAAARRGDLEATVLATERATRHILATTVTTFAGFTPLVLAGGGFWPPLAVIIAGGLVGATIIALTLVPALHRQLARFGKGLPA